MNARYVLFSDQAGVFLGFKEDQAVWSRRSPKPLPAAAPTFANQDEAEQALDALAATGLGEGDSYKLVQVHPDLPEDFASPDTCKNALLPSWV